MKDIAEAISEIMILISSIVSPSAKFKNLQLPNSRLYSIPPIYLFGIIKGMGGSAISISW
jgi:hypothetical protein